MREKGFYWVKFNNEWVIAEYTIDSNNIGNWILTFENKLYTDAFFQEINENRLIYNG